MTEEKQTPKDASEPEAASSPAGDESESAPASDASTESPPETPAEESAPEAEAQAPNEEPAPEPEAEVPAEEPAPEAVAEETAEEAAPEPVAEAPAPEPVAGEPAGADEEEEEEAAPRMKPAVPGADLEVDIVPEGFDPLAPTEVVDPYAIEDFEVASVEPLEEEEEPVEQPITSVAIDLAAGARYTATGKRKTAVARVILRPGDGSYTVNGRRLEEHFPRETLQRNIRQPLETVGYEARMDVVARLHGGGVSAQADALRHGISRALLDADPNLRGELKRRGFLTRDARAKERKKAGLKKARKRPQFSKRYPRVRPEDGAPAVWH